MEPNIKIDINKCSNVYVKMNADSSVEPSELGVTAYPLVSIVNSTPFIADGDVKYPTFLCSKDRYS